MVSEPTSQTKAEDQRPLFGPQPSQFTAQRNTGSTLFSVNELQNVAARLATHGRDGDVATSGLIDLSDLEKRKVPRDTHLLRSPNVAASTSDDERSIDGPSAGRRRAVIFAASSVLLAVVVVLFAST